MNEGMPIYKSPLEKGRMILIFKVELEDIDPDTEKTRRRYARGMSEEDGAQGPWHSVPATVKASSEHITPWQMFSSYYCFVICFENITFTFLQCSSLFMVNLCNQLFAELD